MQSPLQTSALKLLQSNFLTFTTCKETGWTCIEFLVSLAEKALQLITDSIGNAKQLWEGSGMAADDRHVTFHAYCVPCERARTSTLASGHRTAKSQRISDCRTAATVTDSQTATPRTSLRPPSTLLEENLQRRVEPHPAWTAARELFTPPAIRGFLMRSYADCALLNTHWCPTGARLGCFLHFLTVVALRTKWRG